MTEDEVQEAAADAGVGELAIAMRRAIRDMGEGLDDLMSAEPPAVGQKVAEAQAQANEMAAALLSAHPARHGPALANALRFLTWASGFDFDGSPPPPDPIRLAKKALILLRLAGGIQGIGSVLAEASALEDDARGERAALSGMRPDAPALVYLVAHSGLGAVKVGVSEPAGSRIAHHRRQGWQLVAAFLVTAKAAASIETDILNGWRRRGLPTAVGAGQMPQGGWTETVAADGIDLAADVARACELALAPEARPHPVSPWGQGSASTTWPPT
jgi:hypothetical protein